MTQSPSNECPKPSLLIEFLQGKLEPPALDDCEAHLAQCTQCHETLRGLDSDDTLSEKVAAALISNHPDQDSGSLEIDGLITRLTSTEFKSRSSIASHLATSEVMADRAAEVLRCVEPDDETLGLFGDYALLRLIGSGSTGVVFQALDRTLQRTVALKVLRPSLGVVARDRFLAEARSAASIEHPNVVTIFQVGQVDRLAFIAMQWLPGETLESKLQSGVNLDDSQITDTVLRVASGLAAAHQKQLVHRDIKPANMWICDTDQQIKILDFGLARINDDNPGLTATGMLAGTPNFMSPEQARGQELDGRSDLFSLGCLMYQLLTGRLPFGASTILGTLQSVQNESPIPPRQIKPDVPQHLSDLTMCLLEKQPANRPESANQLIEMLSSPRGDWPISVNQYFGSPEGKTEVSHASVKVQRRSGGMRWLMTGILLGLVGWGAWLWSPQIIRVMTDQGEVVIESKVDDVEIQVFAEGKLIRVVDTKTKQSFDLKSGKYTFAARSSVDGKNTFEVLPNQLTMSRGSTQLVKVTTVGLTAARVSLKSYSIATDPKVALSVIKTMLDGSDATIGQDAVTGAIVLRGSERAHKIVQETIATLRGELVTTQVFQLQNTKASSILEAVESSMNLPTSRGKGEITKGPKLIADDDENQIIFSGTPVEVSKIAETIGRLDQKQPPESKRFVPSVRSSAALPSDKPVFKNQTFEQWLRVARRDRDAATRSGALKACAATAETASETESLIALTRKICREQGGNTLGLNSEKDLYHAAITQAVNSLDVNQISKFIEMEIAKGTEASRKFCSGWLFTLIDGVISKEWQAKVKSVIKMAEPIEVALASHLEKPGNSWILFSLAQRIKKENFKDTALAKAMKQSAAKPDQRLLLHRSIIVLLGDDLEMFQLFRNDLLDPKTDPETREKFFYSLLHNNNHQRPLPRQWQQLLFDVADGVLRQGDQRLEFAKDFYSGTVERLKAEHVLTEVLIGLNRLEPQLDAKFKTETLQAQLKELRAAVEKAANDPERAEDFIDANVKTLLADFDYMIKKASGDSDAEMPESSFLKRGGYPWTSTGGGFGGAGGGGMF